MSRPYSTAKNIACICCPSSQRSTAISWRHGVAAGEKKKEKQSLFVVEAHLNRAESRASKKKKPLCCAGRKRLPGPAWLDRVWPAHNKSPGLGNNRGGADPSQQAFALLALTQRRETGPRGWPWAPVGYAADPCLVVSATFPCRPLASGRMSKKQIRLSRELSRRSAFTQGVSLSSNGKKTAYPRTLLGSFSKGRGFPLCLWLHDPRLSVPCLSELDG